jgi:hypothetical protein
MRGELFCSKNVNRCIQEIARFQAGSSSKSALAISRKSGDTLAGIAGSWRVFRILKRGWRVERSYHVDDIKPSNRDWIRLRVHF